MSAGVIKLLNDYPRLRKLAEILVEKTKSESVSSDERKEAELALKELRILAENAYPQQSKTA